MKLNADQAYLLIKEQIERHKKDAPLVVAIDGRSASGKTTFSKRFEAFAEVCVIRTDDFFRPRNSNGQLEISEFDGNFDIDRFKNEVIKNLNSKESFCYGVFNCALGVITETVQVDKPECIIIEGSYSQNPKLGDYADIKLFFDIEKQTQKMRICQRNGSDAYERFLTLWIPAEERYIKHYGIDKHSDHTVATEVN